MAERVQRLQPTIACLQEPRDAESVLDAWFVFFWFDGFRTFFFCFLEANAAPFGKPHVVGSLRAGRK